MPRAVVMLALVLLAPATLGACDGCEPGPELPPPPKGSVARSTPSVVPASAAPAQLAGRWTVYDGDAGILSLSIAGDVVEITTGALRGEPQGRSRRYRDAKGAVVVDASRGPMAILREPSGTVAWRFSTARGVTRFWQGVAAKTPAYEVRNGEVRRGAERLGKVSAIDDGLAIEDATGERRFVVRGPRTVPAAWAPMLFADLESPLRGVLVAEALWRARPE